MRGVDAPGLLNTDGVLSSLTSIGGDSRGLEASRARLFTSPGRTVGTEVGSPGRTVGTEVGSPGRTVGTEVGSPGHTDGTEVGSPGHTDGTKVVVAGHGHRLGHGKASPAIHRNGSPLLQDESTMDHAEEKTLGSTARRSDRSRRVVWAS